MRRKIHKLVVNEDHLIVFFARSIYKISIKGKPKALLGWDGFKYMNILKHRTYTRVVLSKGIDRFSLQLAEVFYNDSGAEPEVTRINKTDVLKLCL